MWHNFIPHLTRFLCLCFLTSHFIFFGVWILDWYSAKFLNYI
uniref:Uncharacterized protein n=1 Tax=Arundo donax TaxID=35708 RepID=A0A0A8ZJE0_ARUDO